jgi:hypothetical protein
VAGTHFSGLPHGRRVGPVATVEPACPIGRPQCSSLVLNSLMPKLGPLATRLASAAPAATCSPDRLYHGQHTHIRGSAAMKNSCKCRLCCHLALAVQWALLPHYECRTLRGTRYNIHQGTPLSGSSHQVQFSDELSEGITYHACKHSSIDVPLCAQQQRSQSVISHCPVAFSMCCSCTTPCLAHTPQTQLGMLSAHPAPPSLSVKAPSHKQHANMTHVSPGAE